MTKYRMTVYDPMHDIWILEKRIFFLFWLQLSAGSKAAVERSVRELNAARQGKP